MKASFAKLMLASLVACASMSTAAVAGDWDYGSGGLKGMRGSAVPVPAPTPIPEYSAQWYFRADVGIGLGNQPNVSERGIQYGDVDGPLVLGVPTPFSLGGSNFTSFFFNKDFETFATFGVGVGYYWSPSFRTDLTMDARSRAEVKIDGTYNYDASGPLLGSSVSGTVRDSTTLRSGIFLANAYYDVGRYGSLKPYFGLGLGFAYNELERKNDTVEMNCVLPCVSPTTPTAGRSYSSNSKEHTVTLAAALMAGVTYNISHSTKLDLNYRYLYMGATHADLTVNGSSSRISFDDQHEHQLRVGVRWDVN